MLSTNKKRLFASLLSGLLFVIGFPEIGNLSVLSFFAFIPLLWVEHSVFESKDKSRKVFIYAYLAFIVFNIGTTWWIWNASVGGAIMAFTMNSLVMTVFFQLFHITKKITGKKIGMISFVLYWIAFEYIHYQWELSHPWLTLGNFFANNPYLIQWYSITGVLGGSLWVLILNLLGFSLIKKLIFSKESLVLNKKRIIIYASILIVPIIGSLIMYYNSPDIGTPTQVVVTQPNVDPYNEKFTGNIEDQLDRICDLADSKTNKKTDFVLAPETALPFSFYEDEVERIIYYHYLVERKANWNTASLLIGASTKKFFKNKRSRASKKIFGGPGYEEFYNSSMLIDQMDKPKFIHKSKLVLGVEKVPFSNVFPQLEQLSINNGGASGTLGIEDYAQVLTSRGITFAPVVCYESIYGGFISEQCKKGAELIFIITNDGWWGNTPGYKQHLAFARLRAIENRKSIARSANTGTSCFINQRGDVIKKTEWWKEASIKSSLKRNSIKTFYSMNGDIIGRNLGAAATILFFYTVYLFFKRRKKTHSSE
jgi:apolipoprotein N-acyltransferase